MRTLLGVTLAAFAAGGCSLALDMDRFGRGGDEKIVLNDANEARSGTIEDKSSGSSDAGKPGNGTEPNGNGGTEPSTPADAGAKPAPPACTISEVEPNNTDNNAQDIGLGTLCGVVSGDRDMDRFDFVTSNNATIEIQGSPQVTVQVFRNGVSLITHQGAGLTTYGLQMGAYEIWAHGLAPGMMPYRITLK